MSDLPPSPLPPSGPPPGIYAAVDKDSEHLKILSICWYVVAGLQALGGCIGLGYIAFGILMGLGIASSNDRDAAAAGLGVGGFVTCIGLVMLAIAWGIAFLNYKVGRSLVARRNRTLCFIMAIIACLGVPLGTILGVFTLIVLSRPSVQSSFT